MKRPNSLTKLWIENTNLSLSLYLFNRYFCSNEVFSSNFDDISYLFFPTNFEEQFKFYILNVRIAFKLKQVDLFFIDNLFIFFSYYYSKLCNFIAVLH